MRILGLMSGTSCDGLDCIDINLDVSKSYNLNFEINNFFTVPYSKADRSYLLSIRGKESCLVEDSDKVTRIFIDSINSFFNHSKSDYHMIACHGHTVKHIDKVVSIQLISPDILYHEYRVPIVYNFRELDICEGGNGAPLMPFLDYLLFRDSNIDIITLNIGGISNISYIPSSGFRNKVLGFDTGPGMSLVDKASEVFFDSDVDLNGIYSKQGKIDSILLEELMSIGYIVKDPPKSTDIDEFGYELINSIKLRYGELSGHDIVRTFVQFTINSIELNINKFINSKNFKLIYSGGGTNHPIILEWLKKSSYDSKSISDYGIDSSIKESMLIASLGVAKLRNIPSNMPSVTGAKNNIVLGDIYGDSDI